jgi:phosphoglycerate kinase
MNSLNSLELKNKNIVLRVDLNVPIQDGKILDRTRIDAVRPTIDFLLSQDSRILLISHLGRPTEGNLESKYSLRPIKEEFEKI